MGCGSSLSSVGQPPVKAPAGSAIAAVRLSHACRLESQEVLDGLPRLLSNRSLNVAGVSQINQVSLREGKLLAKTEHDELANLPAYNLCGKRSEGVVQCSSTDKAFIEDGRCWLGCVEPQQRDVDGNVLKVRESRATLPIESAVDTEQLPSASEDSQLKMDCSRATALRSDSPHSRLARHTWLATSVLTPQAPLAVNMNGKKRPPQHVRILERPSTQGQGIQPGHPKQFSWIPSVGTWTVHYFMEVEQLRRPKSLKADEIQSANTDIRETNMCGKAPEDANTGKDVEAHQSQLNVEGTTRSYEETFNSSGREDDNRIRSLQTYEKHEILLETKFVLQKLQEHFECASDTSWPSEVSAIDHSDTLRTQTSQTTDAEIHKDVFSDYPADARESNDREVLSSGRLRFASAVMANTPQLSPPPPLPRLFRTASNVAAPCLPVAPSQPRPEGVPTRPRPRCDEAPLPLSTAVWESLPETHGRPCSTDACPMLYDPLTLVTANAEDFIADGFGLEETRAMLDVILERLAAHATEEATAVADDEDEESEKAAKVRVKMQFHLDDATDRETIEKGVQTSEQIQEDIDGKFEDAKEQLLPASEVSCDEGISDKHSVCEVCGKARLVLEDAIDNGKLDSTLRQLLTHRVCDKMNLALEDALDDGTLEETLKRVRNRKAREEVRLALEEALQNGMLEKRVEELRKTQSWKKDSLALAEEHDDSSLAWNAKEFRNTQVRAELRSVLEKKLVSGTLEKIVQETRSHEVREKIQSTLEDGIGDCTLEKCLLELKVCRANERITSGLADEIDDGGAETGMQIVRNQQAELEEPEVVPEDSWKEEDVVEPDSFQGPLMSAMLDDGHVQHTLRIRTIKVLPSTSDGWFLSRH